MNYYKNVNGSISLKHKEGRTRHHEVALVKQQSRVDVKEISILQRTMNDRNNLSVHCLKCYA